VQQHVEEVTDAVVRVRADNPGLMTLEGTNTWLLHPSGSAAAVVIDPGPPLPEHVRRIHDVLRARGAEVAAVLLTHGHLDHSEGAQEFAEREGTTVRAASERWSTADVLTDGELVAAADIEARVVATPGHTSDSVSFIVDDVMFTGDTVLGRGTTVIAHPDGHLGDYLTSLAVLRSRAATGTRLLLPGHGPVVADPVAWIDYYLEHRHSRLRQITEAMAALDLAPPTLTEAGELADDAVVDAVVARVYADVPQSLWPAAAVSVRAQLVLLAERGTP
jgi:glyoxylase-like metal-dependent hydrolase (beta-lactamase superfamily II)